MILNQKLFESFTENWPKPVDYEETEIATEDDFGYDYDDDNLDAEISVMEDCKKATDKAVKKLTEEDEVEEAEEIDESADQKPAKKGRATAEDKFMKKLDKAIDKTFGLNDTNTKKDKPGDKVNEAIDARAIEKQIWDMLNEGVEETDECKDGNCEDKKVNEDLATDLARQIEDMLSEDLDETEEEVEVEDIEEGFEDFGEIEEYDDAHYTGDWPEPTVDVE